MAKRSKYLILKDIIDKTYLEVYKIPIKISPGINFEHIKNTYNFLSKATNIDLTDFIKFTMENWLVIMSKIAAPSTREQECMKTFHIGYFAAAIEQFLIIYADRKDLIGYIPGDFRHNEIVDLVRKGLSKEDAEKKIEAKYNTEKPKANPVEVEKLIRENAKLKEQMSNLLSSMQNRQTKDKEEIDNLNLEIRELKDVVQKYRTGQLQSNFRPSMIGKGMYPSLDIHSVPYPELPYAEFAPGALDVLFRPKTVDFHTVPQDFIDTRMKTMESTDIFSNWHEADEARREEIRKTRQYITQHEMYEGFWSLLDSKKEPSN